MAAAVHRKPVLCLEQRRDGRARRRAVQQTTDATATEAARARGSAGDTTESTEAGRRSAGEAAPGSAPRETTIAVRRPEAARAAGRRRRARGRDRTRVRLRDRRQRVRGRRGETERDRDDGDQGAEPSAQTRGDRDRPRTPRARRPRSSCATSGTTWACDSTIRTSTAW